MSLRRRPRVRTAALLLLGGAVAFAAAGGSANAVEPGFGSRNFTAPGSVPNYFSNEASPFQGAAGAAQPGADRYSAAPAYSYAAGVAPRRYYRAARGKQRGRLARGRVSSSRELARAGAPKGGRTVIAAGTRSTQGKSAAKSMKTAASQPKQAARSAR